MSARRSLEIWGELRASVGDTTVEIEAAGPVITVRLADAAAASRALRSLPALPSELLLRGLHALSTAGLTVQVLIAGARVAQLGANTSGLSSLLGVKGVKVDVWQAVRSMLYPTASN